MLGLGLVAFLHPDAGKGGIDEQVVGAEGVGPVGGDERIIEAAQREIDLGQRMPRPGAVLVVSPHWMAPMFAVKQDQRYRAWHDFGGFPDALYRLQYDAPGAPGLARNVVAGLQQAGIATQLLSDARIDHGVWVPLMLMFPQADVPVINIASPGRDPRAHYELGRALAAMLEEDVLIIGSGGAVHNLRDLAAPGTPPAPWA